MYFRIQDCPIRIVARPKLSGLGEHWGVQLSDGTVAHRTQERIEVVGLRVFAQGRPVREVKRARADEYSRIYQRLHAALRAPTDYRLINENCEHFATWLIGEPRESPQVIGWALVGLAAIAVNAIART
jgi:hypothetical protein